MEKIVVVDIEYNENCGGEISARFQAAGDAKPVAGVKLGGVLYDVTGWSESGACEARAVPVEDSGGGVVMLIYGGAHGIRLRKAENAEAWDLMNKEQAGEFFIKVDEKCVFTKS